MLGKDLVYPGLCRSWMSCRVDLQKVKAWDLKYHLANLVWPRVFKGSWLKSLKDKDWDLRYHLADRGQLGVRSGTGLGFLMGFLSLMSNSTRDKKTTVSRVGIKKKYSTQTEINST